jgi:23S rRNA (adenine2503-C2)-methyltransferase
MGRATPERAGRPGALGLAREDLRAFMRDLGQPAFRGDQVYQWIWQRGVMDAEAMTDLPIGLRSALGGGLDWSVPAPRETLGDRDGTMKLVVGLADGARVETVLIPRPDVFSGDEDESRAAGDAMPWTVCVSTQVGCRMRCVFCRSGRDGLRRNLGPEEIAGQLFVAERLLPPGGKIRKVVLMGIGEPLDNYEGTLGAIKVFLSRRSRVLSNGRIVVSTIGLPAAIRRLDADLGGKVSLALSLHSPSARKRKAIVRGAGDDAPQKILEAALEFRHPPRERLTVEYVISAGLNDSQEDAAELADLLRGHRCMVNLIPVNPVPGLRFEAPSRGRLEAFQALLRREGVAAFVRRRRGGSIRAACGQLAFGHD